MKTLIRIGTRSSKLALWQAYHVADLLQKGGLETEIVPIESKGDKIQHVSFTKIGSKGLFTEELEEQLHRGEIDIAVHSAKDMQSELPEGLEIIAYTQREEANDVVISFDKTFSLENASSDVIVGTSSTRRRSILKHYYPHIRVTEARGNLQTRLRKMEEGNCQALLLAYAGVHRMNYDEYIVQKLPLNIFTPAVGQGSIAVEASSLMNQEIKELIQKLVNDEKTAFCLTAERAFLRRLQGGCSIPVFALAILEEDTVRIEGGVVSLDGEKIIRETVSGHKESAEDLGIQLGEKIAHAGGDEILQEIKKQRS